MRQQTVESSATEEIPYASIRGLTDFGDFEGRGFDVARGEISAGVGITALFEGVKNDFCQRPHWGYILDGVLHVGYIDETEEVIKAGDAFFLPPGHVIYTEDEAVEFILFSPHRDPGEVLNQPPRKTSGLDPQKDNWDRIPI